LVTALHVVEQVMLADACVVNICGTGVILEHIAFFPDEDNDLAFAPLDGILMRHGVTRIVAIELDAQEDGSEEVGYHLLMGYPASKNKLDLKFNEIERRLHSLTAKSVSPPQRLVTTIKEPRFFGYDPKSQVDSQIRPVQPPGLHGMSGGPALELRASRHIGNEYRFHIRLSGVLVEWRQQEKVVVAASAVALREALRKVEEFQG
jgi:hypothetical protein